MPGQENLDQNYITAKRKLNMSSLRKEMLAILYQQYL
jgi:hypothetical protein